MRQSTRFVVGIVASLAAALIVPVVIGLMPVQEALLALAVMVGTLAWAGVLAWWTMRGPEG